MRHIILASGSPRRKELLEKMGLDFTAVPSDFSEYLDDSRPVEDIATELALGKARAVAEKYPDAIVIGADTIVTVEGKQLGKPIDIDDARKMWRICVTAPNKITTSLAIICKAENYEHTAYDNAFVTLKPYDETAIETYLATGDYKDKAGAWSIQKACQLMEGFEGDEETILGMPTNKLKEILNQML